MGILQSFQGIGEEVLHLLLRLDVILSALVAHPVLIRHLFSSLDAQENVVGLFILPVNIVAVVGGN